ncbi:MAG TPA: tetratricopeptide repeat protein, partial [Gemmatimonadales bacterium]|nr:tetratricopeptide repeat protein [Gemmatimonadales bacterium]
GGRRSAAVDAFKRAYEHRNRLTDRERYLTQAAYHAFVEGDRESSIADYRSLLDIYPSDVVALNNLSILYSELRNFEEAAELARRATLVQPANITFWSNYLNALVGQGKVDSAEAALRAVEGSVRSQPFASELELSVAALKGDYDSVEAGVRRIRDSRRESLDWQTTTSSQLAALAALRGKLDQSEQHLRAAAEASAAQNLPERALFYEAAGAGLETWYRGQPARALRRLDDALRRRPLAGLDVRDRPYLPLAVVYAEAGRPDRARALVAEFDRLAPEGDRRLAESERHAALGAIALAERRPREAVEEFRLQDEGDCTVCAVASLGRAYEAAGNADSAIAAYERYVATPMLGRLVLDAIWLPRTYLRLGELYEERGNRSRAAEYYARLVRLWKDPDPELRMKVGEAKRRLEALTGERAAS